MVTQNLPLRVISPHQPTIARTIASPQVTISNIGSPAATVTAGSPGGYVSSPYIVAASPPLSDDSLKLPISRCKGQSKPKQRRSSHNVIEKRSVNAGLLSYKSS